jgi:hypothetical protein
MSVTAPPAALANSDYAPPALAPCLDASAREAAGPVRLPDQVALSPGALLRQLLEVQSVALRQLAALLPLIETVARADLPNPAPVPLGHLATAVGEVARQVGADYGAVLSTAASKVPLGSEHPAFGSIEHWRGEASATLRNAADLLEHVEHRLREPALLAAQDTAPEVAPSPPQLAVVDALWVLSQVVTAQRHVAWALRGLASPLSAGNARRRGRILTGRPDRATVLAGAIALLGVAILALLLWLAVGWWLAVAGVAGVLATFAAWAGWGWRVAVTWRGLRLELRR